MSHAQIEARKRNHTIMRLRGAYQLFRQLRSFRGTVAVDELLEQLGAETQTERLARERKELLNA